MGYSDINAFIKEVYNNSKLAKIYDKSGVAMQIINRDYEGDVKKGGDTVHIRTLGNVVAHDYSGSLTYDSISGTSDTLVIDQKKSFAFEVDDIDKVQSDIELIDNYKKIAMVSIDLAKDSHIMTKAFAGADSGNDVSYTLTKNNAYAMLREIMRKLSNSNSVKNGKQPNGQRPWIVVNPDIVEILSQAPQLIQPTPQGEKVIREGVLGVVGGFDLLESTNFSSTGSATYQIIAGTNEGITFASQFEEYEILRLENSFATGARGLYVYGAKVVNSKALSAITVVIA
jgi:hypothetical protein